MINKPLSNHKRNFKASILCFFLFCKLRLSSVPNHRFLVKNFMAMCYEEKRDQQVNFVFLGVSFQQFFLLSTHLFLCFFSLVSLLFKYKCVCVCQCSEKDIILISSLRRIVKGIGCIVLDLREFLFQ